MPPKGSKKKKDAMQEEVAPAPQLFDWATVPKGKITAGYNYKDYYGSVPQGQRPPFPHPYFSGANPGIFKQAEKHFENLPITAKSVREFNNHMYARFMGGNYDIGIVQFVPVTKQQIIDYFDAMKKNWRTLPVHAPMEYPKVRTGILRGNIKYRPLSYLAKPHVYNYAVTELELFKNQGDRGQALTNEQKTALAAYDAYNAEKKKRTPKKKKKGVSKPKCKGRR
jgi:hypothetical protein